MKTKIVSLYLLMPFFMACQNKKENLKVDNDSKQKNTIINNEQMEEILFLQLKRGYSKYYNQAGVEIPQEEFNAADIDATVQICKKNLSSNGYLFINKEKFSSIVKELFDRTIDYNSDKSYLYVNYFNKCDRKIHYFPNNETEYYGTYIVKNENFITDFYFIPELINYTKDYPKSIDIENNIHTKSINDNNEEITTVLWKEIENSKDIANSLNDKRKRNIETLVARNMYLFNDSKAYFRWLVLNDQYFMRSLVTTFGYYEDKELVKWVIENTESYDDDQYKKSDFKGLSEILWNKKCDNSYVINTNALQIIKEISTPKNYSRIFDVYTILQDLVHSNEEFSFDEIPFKNKAKIVAHLLEFGEQFKYDEAYGYNQMFLGKFIYYLDTKKKYINEFELNNYYNLPNLKKWYQLAKTEKDKFADDETLMDDPNFTDYLYRSTTFKTPKKMK